MMTSPGICAGTANRSDRPSRYWSASSWAQALSNQHEGVRSVRAAYAMRRATERPKRLLELQNLGAADVDAGANGVPHRFREPGFQALALALQVDEGYRLAGIRHERIRCDLAFLFGAGSSAFYDVGRRGPTRRTRFVRL